MSKIGDAIEGVTCYVPDPAKCPSKAYARRYLNKTLAEEWLVGIETTFHGGKVTIIYEFFPTALKPSPAKIGGA